LSDKTEVKIFQYGDWKKEESELQE